MNSENKGYALAVENGQRQEKREKIYLKPMALYIPQHAVEAVNSLLDDLPAGNEEEEWVSPIIITASRLIKPFPRWRRCATRSPPLIR